LQRVRLANGWSKRVVAQKLGVSIPSIMRWEDGMAEPNDYNRYKIERLLELDPTAGCTPALESGGLRLGLFQDDRRGGAR
jgi:transcriptional regulator with XRE-family HTH domain